MIEVGMSYTSLYNLQSSSPLHLTQAYGLPVTPWCFELEPAYTIGIPPFSLDQSNIFNVDSKLLMMWCLGSLSDVCILANAATWNITSQSNI